MRQHRAMKLQVCALLLIGCASTGGAVWPSGSSGASMCGALEPLVALRTAMTERASFAEWTEQYPLVDTDHELGHVQVALSRLQDNSETRALRTKLGSVGALLEGRRGRLLEAFQAAGHTYQDAWLAVRDAAKCRGQDLSEDPAQSKNRAPHMRSASSNMCESAQRLWATVSRVELTSSISVAAIASHVRELSLDKETSARRTLLVETLTRHKESLERLRGFAEGPDAQDPETKELVRTRAETVKDLDGLYASCASNARSLDRVVAGDPEPRRATVTVRPKWSGALEALGAGAQSAQFGSGFVVRWRNANGVEEARVVTNNHVLGGATEAEVVSGDQAQQSATAAGARRPAERVVRNARAFRPVRRRGDSETRTPSGAFRFVSQGSAFPPFSGARAGARYGGGLSRDRHPAVVPGHQGRDLQCRVSHEPIGLRRQGCVPAAHGADRPRKQRRPPARRRRCASGYEYPQNRGS